jgi:uncharacterized RDD family membrane protein YckC
MSDKIGFFEEDPGVRSMARLLAFMAACAGSVVIVVGLCFLSPPILGIGAGLFGSGELLKYGQRRVEK